MAGASAAQTPQRRITTELACVNCGHLLVGQQPDGLCPECGKPVRWSLYGSKLPAADNRWLRRCYLGATLATHTRLWFWFPPAWLLIVAAVWLLTVRNPSGTFGRRSLAWALRLGTPVSYLLLGGYAAFLQWNNALMQLDSLLSVVCAAYAISHVALTAAVWSYARENARRWERFVLATAGTGVFTFGLLLGFLGLVGLATVIDITQGTVPTRLRDLIESSQAAVILVSATVAVPAIPGFWILLSLARRRIDQAIYHSEDIRTRIRAWKPWTIDAPASSVHPEAPASVRSG